MNELALFAGAGGGLLGTRLLGWRPICAVEINPYRREVLLRRQEEGHLEPFPIWDDVRTFSAGAWRGRVDVITAGFPCQPFSSMGKQLGCKDPRNMWPETIRAIREVEPQLCFLENTPRLLANRYFGTIVGELQDSGYCVRWRVISAAELGAPHLRNRVWIAAHPKGAECARHGSIKDQEQERPSNNSWWSAKPSMGRVVDGLAYRVDRIKSVGAGQVPAVVKAAWEILADGE